MTFTAKTAISPEVAEVAAATTFTTTGTTTVLLVAVEVEVKAATLKTLAVREPVRTLYPIAAVAEVEVAAMVPVVVKVVLDS